MRIFLLGEDIREEVTVFVSLRHKSGPGVRRRVAQCSGPSLAGTMARPDQSVIQPIVFLPTRDI